MQDVPDSFPPWDDPANASGLGAPAIIRGTVSTYNLSGLTKGAGQSTGVRQANATALQNAINYCCTNGKFLEVVPGMYEINVAGGLTVPATGSGNYGLVLRGSNTGSVINQFYVTASGAPVLTVGDPTNGTISHGVDIHGLCLRYGASVSGLTLAVPLVLGFMTVSSVNAINIEGSTYPPYDAVQIQGQAFSCSFKDYRIWAWQRHGFAITGNAGGTTGNTYDNWYMNAGGTPPSTYGSMSGNYLFFDDDCTDQTFIRLNCEWGATNAVVRSGDSAACHGLNLINMHIEGIKLIGADPAVFHVATTSMNVECLGIQDIVIVAANFTGTAALMSDWQGGWGVTTFTNIDFHQSYTGEQSTTFSLLHSYSLDNNVSIVRMDAGQIRDFSGTAQTTARIQFDQHLAPTTGVTINKWGSYEFGLMGSSIRHAVLTATATYTHYGQFEDATILVPDAITGFTITLAAVMGATGTQLPRFGNTVHIRRLSGSASGTLTVTNGGQAGGNLTAPTTAATSQWYEWRPYLATAANNITQGNWVNITPVT